MKHHTAWAAVLGAASLVAACGREISIAPGGGTSSGTGGRGTGAQSSTSSTSSTSSSSAGGQTCADAADALAKEASGTGSCTSVVRLDYGSLTVLGFKILCGPYAAPDEAAARATAQKDTGYGQSGAALAGAMPSDDFVFMVSAGDFGGSSAVSAHTGLSVFGGSTVWAGKGDITYPEGWRNASELGLGCGQYGLPTPTARGFDLGGGAALPSAQVSAALSRVWETALPGALARVAYLFDAMVLLYPRSVGAFDPATAEWIVLVNSGFLE